jgi:hypothetical protein
MERNEKQLNEGEAAQVDASQGSSTLEHFFQETPITLADIRSTLIRLEETIIFALIERAQFRANPAVYRKDEETEVRQKGKSFLDVFFGQIEKAHSLMRRYTSPDEHPFYPEELERPILPLLNYSAIIRPNNINLNPKAPLPSFPFSSSLHRAPRWAIVGHGPWLTLLLSVDAPHRSCGCTWSASCR